MARSNTSRGIDVMPFYERKGMGPFQFPNFRRYVAGQAISLIGTWMQQIAQGWLVLTLSHSGTALGLIIGAQMLPVLLLGPYGGLIADRSEKRRLLLVTSGLLGTISLITGTLAATHVITLWMLAVLALCIGLTNAIATPARQSFVSELVDRENLRSAVSINSVLVNVARAVGPAIAAVLIATIGIQACFFVDAASYVFVVIALLTMNTSTLRPAERAERAKGQIRQGLRVVRNDARLYAPLVMMVLIGTFAYEFPVTLPLIATETFHGNATTLGMLTTAMGFGAITGGIFVARRGRTGIRAVTLGAALFAGALFMASLAPTLPIEIGLLYLTGIASVQFLAVANSTLQLTVNPMFRGRVMALWTMAFLGSTPIGGPIVGWIGDHLSPRLALGVGSASCVAATILGLVVLRRIAAAEANQPSTSLC